MSESTLKIRDLKTNLNLKIKVLEEFEKFLWKKDDVSFMSALSIK